MLFLLIVGMELNPAQIKTRATNILWTSLLGILIPFSIGIGLVILAPDLWGAQARDNLLPFALFVGTALFHISPAGDQPYFDGPQHAEKPPGHRDYFFSFN